MKRLLLLLIATSAMAQVTAPPVALDNWPTANTALTLADPNLTNQVAGWDNTAKKFVWVTAGGGGTGIGTDTFWAAKGDLAVATANDTASVLSVGTNGQVLTADSTQTTGVKWAAAPGGGTGIGSDTFWAAKGDLAVATANDTASVLSVGTNGQVLTADSTQATGVKWAAVSGSGTVTNPANLATNALVLGGTNGTTDVKTFAAGFTTDGVSKLTLGNTGASGSATGVLALRLSSGGTTTIQPQDSASSNTLTLPAVSLGNLTLTGFLTSGGGTPSTTTFLRGDNTWAAIAAGGSPGYVQYNTSPGILAGVAGFTFDGLAKITLGVAGTSPAGSIDFKNATSGTITLAPPTGALGTITLTLPKVSSTTLVGQSDLGTGVFTFLGTPSSANLLSALTDETGTGKAMFATSPDITTGFTIGTAAGNRKIIVGDGTKFAASTETYATPGTSGQVMVSDGTNWTSAALTASNLPAVAKVGSIGVTLDGGGATVTTGQKGYFIVPYTGTITGWSIVATGTSPTCTFDVWKIGTGSTLPTVSNSITASAKPALATGNALRSTTMTGWTGAGAFTAGDIFGFNLDSVTNATKITFALETTR